MTKIKERFSSSLWVRMGFPTFLAGLILAIPAFGAGFSTGLIASLAYWRGLSFVIAFVLTGAGATLWGWFRDPIEDGSMADNA